MSGREAYQVPTAAAGGNAAGRDVEVAEGPLIQYNCSDCAQKMQLRKSDPIRCKECGGRVLYKVRTKRMVQFEAR